MEVCVYLIWSKHKQLAQIWHAAGIQSTEHGPGTTQATTLKCMVNLATT